MKKPATRLWTLFFACAVLLNLLPAGALAAEAQFPEIPVRLESPEKPAASPAGEYKGTAVIEIRNVDDLAAAIAGQEDGQIWDIAAGVYNLTQDHLDQYAHWDDPGQGGWYLPLHADNLTLVGTGRPVITSSVESANGAWATQDFVSVWGDGITIDGVNFQSKSSPNKAIEIMGKDFTLRNSTLLPVAYPGGEQVFSGSIYFNPANDDRDLGNASLEQVYLHAYISASTAKAGTLQVRNVTLDATNNVWSTWGSGYGPALTGTVYGQVEGVTYLVDEGAILPDLLDAGSPYAAGTKPGTTILFAPGTYEVDAAMTVGKDLTLVGAGPDRTVFQARTEPTVLLQVSGGDVDFSMSGIHVKGVDANSHNNSSALQAGTNGQPHTGSVSIEDCRFSNFTKNSITIKGGTAAITGNVIDCKPYPGAAGNGIQIDMGAEAVITGNTIHGYVSHADSWSACGVLVLRDGKITRIRDNTITDCATGIVKETYYDTDSDRTYLDPDAGRNNTFAGCGQNVDFEFDLLQEIEAYSGGVLRLPCDVTLEEPLTISRDLILDGNGFTIYGQAEDPSVCIQVTGGTFRLSDVTLQDFGGAAEGRSETGVIRVPASAEPDTAVILSDVHWKNFSSLGFHIEAGSFTLTGGTMDFGGVSQGTGPITGIRIGGVDRRVTGTLSGVTVVDSASDTADRDTTALEILNNAEVDVKDCTVRQVRRGIVVENAWRDNSGGIAVTIRGTVLTARQDAVLLRSDSGTASGAAVQISSGEFTGSVRMENAGDRDTISITGGRFSQDPTAYVAPGYQVSGGSGGYWVQPETPGGGPPDQGGSPGGDSSGDSSDTKPQPGKPSDPETSGDTTTVSTPVTPTISGGTAKAEVDSGVMDAAVERVLEAAAESNTAPVVQIVVDSGGADRVEVLLPVSALDTLGRHQQAALTVTSGLASVTLDSAAITTAANQALGEQITLAVAPVASGDLNAQQQAAVGDAPVFELHLKSGGTSISHFGGGSAMVSIPHALSDDQTEEGVAVYHLDDQGKLTLRSTSYDAEAGKVTFTTPHFSKYVVGYQEGLTANPFVDVSEEDYFYTSVLWAVNQGVTLGTSAATFSPYRVCTRARAAMLLWRAAGSPEPSHPANPFTDVNEDDDYYKAVLWAVEQGITAGTAPNTFSPDAPCTRAQIVTFLWRYSQAARTGERKFTDVAQAAYYYEAVQWAAGNGITTGVTETLFAPDDPCTRGQIVTFLYRALA